MIIINSSTIEEIAGKAVQSDLAGQINQARQYSRQLLKYIKENRRVMKNIQKFGIIGKAFAFMQEQNVTEDVMDNQLICEMGYLFNSKEMKTNVHNHFAILYRLNILYAYEDFFPDIIMDALNIKISLIDFMRSPTNIKYELRDYLDMMRISDFENKMAFYKSDTFLVQKKEECDELIAEEYFGAKTKLEIIEEGLELHDKLIVYLDSTLN